MPSVGSSQYFRSAVDVIMQSPPMCRDGGGVSDVGVEVTVSLQWVLHCRLVVLVMAVEISAEICKDVFWSVTPFRIRAVVDAALFE